MRDWRDGVLGRALECTNYHFEFPALPRIDFPQPTLAPCRAACHLFETHEQERFLDSYPSRQVMNLDLDGSVFAVAAFYLCAKKLNVRVFLFLSDTL